MFVTRLIIAGVELPTVQKLAGHRDIKTTLGYYTNVGSKDLRAGASQPGELARTAKSAL